MINSLSIKNFALIENSTIEFGSGFNVLMGETGSGKSIIIDALTFVLGAKADKEFIRAGKESLRVEAVFDCCSANIISALADNGIEFEDGDSIIFSRTLNISGKSEQRINGTSVTLLTLKGIASLLLNVFSQNENAVLLNDKNHIKILDSFDELALASEKQQISKFLLELAAVKSKISAIGGDKAERARKIDLLSYQIEEISGANLQEAEDDELKLKLTRLSNIEKISSALSDATSLLDGQQFNSVESIKSTVRTLASVSDYDEQIATLKDRLSSCEYEIMDISSCIGDMLRTLVLDENEIEKTYDRLEIINSLKRKYGASIDEINSYLSNAQSELEALVGGEETLAKLNVQKDDILKCLYNASKLLSEKRKSIALEIQQKVKAELCDLNMKNTLFRINFESVNEDYKNISYNQDGFDKVSFTFSANLGNDLKSLSKTISGGEMSRFMLALKTVVNFSTDALLVFDEIDSGISGSTANAVAEKLAMISRKNQLLCISHLPCVCAMADKALKVRKFAQDGQTFSVCEDVNKNDFVAEIAKIAGGEVALESSTQYAKSLVESSIKFKQTLNKK